MYLLRALAMPLQFASLLFVGLLGLFFTAATLVMGSVPYMWILPTCFLLFWLAKYGYACLEQAAEGVPQAPVASLEMLGPFEGRGPGVQLLAGAAIYWLGTSLGGWPAQALAGIAILLLPASVGALGVTHRLRDAVNPLTLARVAVGLGPLYLLILVAVASLSAAAMGLQRIEMPTVLRYSLLELLALSAFCLLGGCLYQRRLVLGFEPRSSPERRAEAKRRERDSQLQRMLDGVYEPLRARNYPAAQAVLREYLAGATPAERAREVPAIMARALEWDDERGLVAVSDCLIAQLLKASEPAPALAVLDLASARLPGFAPASEEQARTLAAFARSVGRAGLAHKLLARAPP